jgi:SAM-dependent methyltransferase
MEPVSAVVVGVLLAFVFWAVTFVIVPLMAGAPFETTKDERLRKMIRFARVKKGEKVAELGSGNGKVLMEFARRGAKVHGYEINPLMVLLSRWKIRKAGLKGRAFVHWKNFWRVDLGKFDVISTFQVGYVMGLLERKLKREARSKMRIVSNNWKFPSLKCLKENDGVYYYEI